MLFAKVFRHTVLTTLLLWLLNALSVKHFNLSNHSRKSSMSFNKQYERCFLLPAHIKLMGLKMAFV